MLADKVGLLRIIIVGMMAMLLLSIPIFYLLSTAQFSLMMFGLTLMSILIAITYAPMNAYMVSLFPKEYRYTGFGFAFNLGAALFGGTTPMIMHINMCHIANDDSMEVTQQVFVDITPIQVTL